ncbi:MAG: hypothetical protein WAU39_11605 [Polyangiales bacterium]
MTTRSTLFKLSIVTFIAASAMAACHKDKTSIPLSWRNPGFEDAFFRKLFIIGIGRDESARRMFEDTFVKALDARGAEAQSSWTVLPQSEQLTEEQIRSAIDGGGFDGVLITRLLSVEEAQEYVQGKSYVVPKTTHYGYGYYGYYSYYGTSYATVHEPGSIKTNTTVRLETNLYSVATGGLVWSGQTDTINPDSVSELIDSMTAAVTKQLAEEKLIP